jgi:16S rRNA (cytidine1402-2'-O)-methyltransferase
VTDAGMPAISDPGEDLVRLCAEAGVEVVAVPGPSAFVSALALSGLRTRRFCFEGFLSTSKPGRREHLNSLRFETRTMIFYEAPHKLRGTLSDLLEAFGDRRIAVGRELTKIHEEVLRTTISHAIEHFEAQGARGEFVLIDEGAPSALPTETFLSDALALARSLMEAGTAPAPAAKEAARITGCKKIDIYRELVQKSDADE